MEKTTSGPMTPTLYLLIVLALVLSVAHHVDHVLRGDTGWPLAGGFNPFSASLVIYPLILTGLMLSVLGRVGPRFWAVLSLGGGLFVAAVHLGPVATDTIAGIPAQYGSPVAGGLAVALLVALIGVLVGTFVYEVRLATRQRPIDPERATVVRRAAAFTLLAYGFSWAWWIPLALDGTAIDFGQAAPRYVLGLVGPLVAALVVTAATDGGTAVRSLVARMVRWRVAPRWYPISVAGCSVCWLLATAITVATGGSVPSLEDMGLVPGLPATSVLVVWLYAVLVNGLGEETGWRGFLQPLLAAELPPAHRGLVGVGDLGGVAAPAALGADQLRGDLGPGGAPRLLVRAGGPVGGAGLGVQPLRRERAHRRPVARHLQPCRWHRRRPAGGQRGLHRVRLRLGRDHRLAPGPGPARRSGRRLTAGRAHAPHR